MTRPRLTMMNPVLEVADLDAARAYYRDALGFRVTWTFGDPPVRCGVARDGHELQLAAADGTPASSVVLFHVDGVDELYERCRAGGATIETEIGDRPFGLCDFRVLDPSGNKLIFGAPL